MAALVLGGASACSVAAEDGDLATADDDSAEEAVESTSQAVALAAPELAAVLAAFYSIEITEAQLALTNATDQHVREFAQAMLDHYTAAPARLTGTGSCVFAAFEEEDRARAVMRELPPDWQGYIARGLNRSPLLDRVNKQTIGA